MICTSYDAYILEEDGRIEDQIYKEYVDLNLSNPPAFTWANSSMDALKLLDSDNDFDLIISMINVGELDVFKFSTDRREYTGIAVTGRNCWVFEV